MREPALRVQNRKLVKLYLFKKLTKKSVYQIENIEWANEGSTSKDVIDGLAMSYAHLSASRKKLEDLSVDDV
jgi:hypothetical protein